MDAALSGGDYAELFFEHRTSGNITFEQQVVKCANRSISQGLGVRVLLGEAVGYAYTEDLEPRRDAPCRRHRREDRLPGRRRRPSTSCTTRPPTTTRPQPAPSTSPRRTRCDLMRRADAAARAYDSSIAARRHQLRRRDEARAVFTSDGRMTGDVQPLVRFNVGCLSERDGQRQTARSGGGGRMGMAYFDDHTPEELAREAARQAVLLQSRVEAPAGTFPVVLARRRLAASSCTRRSATASRRTSTARRPATTPTASASSSRRELVHRRRRRHDRRQPRHRSTSTTRATCRAATC